ncbi:AIG2 family protein [Gloeothece citriformis PCC 7424]|uniref:AIG2 family protein n=1 Tax=Gloeothece citriformis (strain PCC 7424) TaxID=65393 RepID=B7KH11_GLOC7|nr:gamma-glutamylcyclotransferase [Gloeothece citriformis]ACK73498.1 AIG2 family protein [Gloeothece citriformis PCC 7424]
MKVFVYGTLKPGECNYPFYCAGKVNETIEAYTYGKLFHLPSYGYPGMTIGNDKVRGVLLTFKDNSALIELDQLEDYDPGRPMIKNEYYREEILVYTLAGELIGKVWSYLMMPEKIEQLAGVFIASGWWTQQDY